MIYPWLQKIPKHFLQDKLFNAENWDSYKLSLYTNIMDLYDLEAPSNDFFYTSKNLDVYTSKQRNTILAISIILFILVSERMDELACYCLTIINKEVTYTKIFQKKYMRYLPRTISLSSYPHSLHVDKLNASLILLVYMDLRRLAINSENL